MGKLGLRRWLKPIWLGFVKMAVGFSERGNDWQLLASKALLSIESLKKVDQKYLESFEMWCWKRMEKISWTDRVRNEEVLHRVKEKRNIIHTVKRRKVNRIGHILRGKCLLKHVIEGKIKGRIEVTRRRGRRRKKLLDDLGDRRGYSFEGGSSRSH